MTPSPLVNGDEKVGRRKSPHFELDVLCDTNKKKLKKYS